MDIKCVMMKSQFKYCKLRKCFVTSISVFLLTRFSNRIIFYIAFQIFFTQNVSLDCLNSVKKYKWKPLLIVIFQTECLVCDLDSKWKLRKWKNRLLYNLLLVFCHNFASIRDVLLTVKLRHARIIDINCCLETILETLEW